MTTREDHPDAARHAHSRALVDTPGHYPYNDISTRGGHPVNQEDTMAEPITASIPEHDDPTCRCGSTELVYRGVAVGYDASAGYYEETSVFQCAACGELISGDDLEFPHEATS